MPHHDEPLYSRVKVAGHPLHPMLVAFPIGFYTGALLGYLAYAGTEDPFWFRLGYVANAAGVLMALVAAVPGFVDWWAGIPRATRAKRDGLIHMVLNVAALFLFAINLAVSDGEWRDTVPNVTPAILLSLLGVAATVGAGWFGWRMVQTHHVGVQPRRADELLEGPGIPVEGLPHKPSPGRPRVR